MLKEKMFSFCFFGFFFKEGVALRFLSQDNKDDSQLARPLRKQKMKFKMVSPNHHLGRKMKC